MVKTRRGLNTSGKATTCKKKGVGPSDDTCMEVESPVVNQEVQKAKWQKSTIKEKWSKTPVSTSMEDDLVLCPTPIRSLLPFNATYGVIHGEIPEVHNDYLPWVDYTNVRELDNPRPSRVNVENDDVGREKSHDEIRVKENVIGEEVAPIVEERVIDSSVAEMLEVVEVSDPSVKPSVEDTMGVEVPSTGTMGVDVNLIVEDTLDGMKNFTPSGGDVLRPSVDDSIKDTVVKDMDVDIPSVVNTEPVIAKAADEGVTLSVTNTDAGTAGNMKRPTVGQGIDDTLDGDI
ncbi:hypothetical protein LIER_03495 [Lithospermum erythrorhizon]|uniref:Uncharacterized protein n=1 Tax=Lithospermum erythrorhizon TaxID=34254 RepID=A0AAV3NUP0_LITER